ncbi:C-type mannose receptor 2 [Elysia marginata]|uniref:C-type mannose receptor 2 n=1 Tax=Elysia marginata TaxID=1093978 RepID=A0AAV4EU58_9GAST|nr:C-type mannose receptor 2 [Elysia marginata]
MITAKIWILSLLVFLTLVTFAEGALRYENIPFLRPDSTRRRPCRPEWTQHKDQCYRIRTSPRLSHRDAQRACQLESSQARLATFTGHTRDFLSLQGDNQSLWITGNEGKCSSFREDGEVESSSGCSDTKGYICEELTKYAGCPKGQIGFGNLCFSVADIEQTWRLARLFCKTVGLRGDLASIHSEEQYDFLSREFGGDEGDQFWIGLHKESPDTPYRWVNGDKVQYLPWAPNYMGRENRSYVSMSLQQRQFQPQENTDLVLPFLCSSVRVVDAKLEILETVTDAAEAVLEEVREAKQAVKAAEEAVINAKKTVLIDAPKAVVEEVVGATQDVAKELADAAADVTKLFSNCDKFWIPFGKYCYKAFFEKTSFIGAFLSCKAKGGNLPSFHSPFQSEFVRTEVIRDSPRDAYWIGLAHDKNGFEWSDGSPVDYMNWDSNEPNNLHLPFFKSCFHLKGLKLKWTPLRCRVLLFYVCEKRAEKDYIHLDSAAATTKNNATRTRIADKPESRPAEKTTATRGQSSHNAGILFGLLGGAIAVVVIAFGAVSLRRRFKNQGVYTYTPVGHGRRTKKATQGVVVEDVTQEQLEMESARVTDLQRVGYDTIE